MKMNFFLFYQYNNKYNEEAGDMPLSHLIEDDEPSMHTVKQFEIVVDEMPKNIYNKMNLLRELNMVQIGSLGELSYVSSLFC